MGDLWFLIGQVEFLRKGALTKRYHTKNTINQNTVGHHSFGVAMMCHLLSPTCSKELILAALCHDLAEQATGDISSPTKRKFPALAEMVQQMEHELLAEHEFDFESRLTPEEAIILKMADCLDGMLFCINEFELGNHSIIEVYNRYVAYADELDSTEEQRMVFAAVRARMRRYQEQIL